VSRIAAIMIALVWISSAALAAWLFYRFFAS
jgi:hypothetical protein